MVDKIVGIINKIVCPHKTWLIISRNSSQTKVPKCCHTSVSLVYTHKIIV